MFLLHAKHLYLLFSCRSSFSLNAPLPYSFICPIHSLFSPVLWTRFFQVIWLRPVSFLGVVSVWIRWMLKLWWNWFLLLLLLMLELLLMLLLLPSFLVIIFCAWFCPVFNNQGIAKEMLFRRQQRWQAARSAYYLPDAPECLRWHPSSDRQVVLVR